MTISKQVPIILLGAIFALLIFGFASVTLAASRTASAALSGSNEVPSNTSMTTGSLSLSYDISASTESASSSVTNMQYTLNANGNDITAAHLHCAPPGVNGPIVVTLFQAPTTPVASSTEATSTATSTLQGTVIEPPHVQANGLLASGSITGADIRSADCMSTIGYNITTLPDLVRAIAAGKIYANIHTLQFPNGAARGQLQLPIMSTLTGTVITPTPTTTPAEDAHQEQIRLLNELRSLLLQIITLIQNLNVSGNSSNSNSGTGNTNQNASSTSSSSNAGSGGSSSSISNSSFNASSNAGNGGSSSSISNGSFDASSRTGNGQSSATITTH